MSREKITDVNIICFNPFDKAKMKLLLTKLLPNNKQQQQQLQQQQLDQTNLLPKKNPINKKSHSQSSYQLDFSDSNLSSNAKNCKNRNCNCAKSSKIHVSYQQNLVKLFKTLQTTIITTNKFTPKKDAIHKKFALTQ